MNFFSSDGFLAAVAKSGFPDRQTRIAEYELDGARYRLLAVDGSQPIVEYPFMDFVEPSGAATAGLSGVSYLPLASTEMVPVSEWRPSEDTQPSPTIRWKQFETLEAFWAHVGTRIGNLVPDSKRKWRKLERDVGAVEYRDDDDRDGIIETCMKWKSAQYRATGLVDMFAKKEHVALFREMKANGSLKVSTLSAGGTVLAIHMGALHERRMYCWIPAYDQIFGRYGPGRLLFHAMMEASFKRGDEEFDFLIGDEAYKWHYATDVRVVRSKGTPPMWLKAKWGVKNVVKGTLKAAGVWEELQAWRVRRRQSA